MNAIDQFRLALAARQLIPPTEIITDGEIHRCNVEGKNGRNDGAYLLHLDGLPAGGFQNHKDGQGWENWHADPGRKLSVTENEALRAKIVAQQIQRDEQYAKECEDVRVRAEEIWEGSSDVVGAHEYLERKNVKAHGVRVYQGDAIIDGTNCNGALVVPIQDSAGYVRQIQLIFPDGRKRFLRGPKPKEFYYVIGSLGDTCCIAEGFATAASIHEATGHAAAVAFDCGGLLPVAEAIRRASPKTKIVICADDDYQTPDNPGITKATAAALATNSLVAIPDFGADRFDGYTDFNDLARLRGAEAVQACVEAAHKREAVPSPPTSPTPTPNQKATVELVRADSVQPEAIDWLWPGWLAAGKLHLLAGAPGTGKTTAALSMAASISSGGGLPDGTAAKIGEVLIWSGEDEVNDTLVPRLMAMGANLANIHFVKSTRVGNETRTFDPAKHMGDLSATIREQGIRPALLIVDPIVSAVAGDSHKNTETRRALQPLVDLGAAEGCAVLGITHFSKGNPGGSVIEKVNGSLAFVAVARLVLVAGQLTDEENADRFLVRAKSNLGSDRNGYLYKLEQRALGSNPEISACVVLWGEPIDGSAREILALAHPGESSETRTQTDDAEDWLQQFLKDGPKEAGVIQQEAEAAGISKRPLRDASVRLQVKRARPTFTGPWVWSLPAVDAPVAAEDAHAAPAIMEGISENGGHLRPDACPVVPENEEFF
jgi:putative DNA primase/helicase